MFLVSSAALMYEISLSRLLAVELWHHYAFLIISGALLGYGAAGAFRLACSRRIPPFLPVLCFSLLLIPLFLLSSHLPFDPALMALDPRAARVQRVGREQVPGMLPCQERLAARLAEVALLQTARVAVVLMGPSGPSPPISDQRPLAPTSAVVAKSWRASGKRSRRAEPVRGTPSNHDCLTAAHLEQ